MQSHAQIKEGTKFIQSIVFYKYKKKLKFLVLEGILIKSTETSS